MSTTTPIAEPVQQNGDGPHDALAHVDEGQIPNDLKKPSNLAVIVATSVFVMLLAALFVIGLVPNRRQAAETRADAKELADDTPTVSVTRAKPTQTVSEVVLPGNVEPFQETSLFARASGYLKTLKVDIGDKVQAGELLAEIDTPEVDAQLAESKAALEQAKASVDKSAADEDLAKRTLDRFEDLVKRDTGGVSQQQLDQERSAYQQAQSSVAAAKANVVAAQAAVQRLTVLQSFEKVTAPFAGTITSRGYDLGALVTAGGASGKELFRLSQTDPMRVFVNVPQTYATNIRTGNEARLRVRNWAGREFNGIVKRTSGALDPDTRTLNVELHFSNSDGALLAGMYGQVSLSVVPDKPLLVVPSSALVYNADGLHVATVQDGNKVKFQRVTIGRDMGLELEVTGGISDGDVIVANPTEQLADGTAVNPVSLRTEPNPGKTALVAPAPTTEPVARPADRKVIARIAEAGASPQ